MENYFKAIDNAFELHKNSNYKLKKNTFRYSSSKKKNCSSMFTKYYFNWYIFFVQESKFPVSKGDQIKKIECSRQ